MYCKAIIAPNVSWSFATAVAAKNVVMMFLSSFKKVFGVNLNKLFPNGKCVTVNNTQTNNDNSTNTLLNAQGVKMDGDEVLALIMKGKDKVIAGKDKIIVAKDEVVAAQRTQTQSLEAEVASLKASQS